MAEELRVGVTGAAGFIGSNFVKWLIQNTASHVLALDNLSTGSRENLAGINSERLAFKQVDITNLLQTLEALDGLDVVFHLAAETHVDNSIENPLPFLHTNVLGTFNVLECARKFKFHLHHVSTDEVFGDLGEFDAPFTEESKYRPSSPYSATKAASDHLVRAWIRTYGIRATLSNCSNNYGPNQNPEKFIPRQFSLLLGGRKIELYGDGSQLRDWIHVDDHSEAMWSIYKKGAIGETYLIGSGQEISNLDMAKLILEVAGHPLTDLKFIEDRKGHDYRYSIDPSKALSELDWAPKRRVIKEELAVIWNQISSKRNTSNSMVATQK